MSAPRFSAGHSFRIVGRRLRTRPARTSARGGAIRPIVRGLSVAPGRPVEHLCIIASGKWSLAGTLLRIERKGVQGVVDDQNVPAQNRASVGNFSRAKQSRHIDMFPERLFSKIVLAALQTHPQRLKGSGSEEVGVHEIAVAGFL